MGARMLAGNTAMNTSSLDLFGLMPEKRMKKEISGVQAQISLRLIVKIFELGGAWVPASALQSGAG
jgi:hypothetical protein